MKWAIVNVVRTKMDFKKLALLAIALTLLLAMSNWGIAQVSSSTNSNDDDTVYEPVKITQGPVVEDVTDSTAIIAWSTNVNSGTTLRYGDDPDNLVKTAQMPWGGFTHRVFLKDLKPGTQYYFQAESAQGQGTGTKATAELKSFQTR
jgi:hypothetical protein